MNPVQRSTPDLFEVEIEQAPVDAAEIEEMIWFGPGRNQGIDLAPLTHGIVLAPMVDGVQPQVDR